MTWLLGPSPLAVCPTPSRNFFTLFWWLVFFILLNSLILCCLCHPCPLFPHPPIGSCRIEKPDSHYVSLQWMTALGSCRHSARALLTCTAAPESSLPSTIHTKCWTSEKYARVLVCFQSLLDYFAVNSTKEKYVLLHFSRPASVSQGEGVAYRGRVLLELTTKLADKPEHKSDDIPPDDLLVVEVRCRRDESYYSRRQQAPTMSLLHIFHRNFSGKGNSPSSLSFTPPHSYRTLTMPSSLRSALVTMATSLTTPACRWPLPPSSAGLCSTVTPESFLIAVLTTSLCAFLIYAMCLPGCHYYYLPWGNVKPVVVLSSEWEDISPRIEALNMLLATLDRLVGYYSLGFVQDGN